MERVNNMPTREEFEGLFNLRARHQEVFGIVEGYRTQNPNFRYAVRQNNNNNRLTYGLIFKGNANYIEIGLSGCNDALNMTRTIYLSVNLINDTVEFHVAYSGNEDGQRQVYENICTTFDLKKNNDFEKRINCNCEVPWEVDLNTTLTNWFDTNYNQLYNLMGGQNIEGQNNILISEKDFDEMINNQVNRGILVNDNGQIRINEDYQPDFKPNEKDITTNHDKQKNESAVTRKPDQVVAPTQVTNIDKPHNLIYFGAPGTGKSYNLNKSLKDSKINYERVTFYPTYSYAQFVGTYKPVMKADEGNEEISYQFVPGPFLRVLVQALKNKEANYCLVIEEINRANAAAVFGDVFQLLDRNSDGESEYSIAASEDIKKYLINQVKDIKDIKDIQVETLSIPQNMYIWATMNSADQGVFPMDTAFKRRWSFEYIEINNGDTGVCNEWEIEGSDINWNVFRKFVNGILSSFDVNEDKLMGPYFVKADNGTQISEKSFASKVLMYLWEDAARMIRKNIFGAEIKTYSQLVSEWKTNKIKIFEKCKSKWENNGELSRLYGDIMNHLGDAQPQPQPPIQAEDVITEG